jgi:DNA anti-recombination protein RmuC
MVDPITLFKAGAAVAGVFSALSGGSSKAKGYKYRASLAEDNARRASTLHAERAERLRKEGLLDTGLFELQAQQSGLAGASADLWIGQRFADVKKEEEKALSTREATVGRFLQEQKWNSENAESSSTSGLLSAVGTAFSAYADYKKGK